MGLRELKETAHQQYVKGKFAQCAKTYQQVLRLAPRDPNMHVRHAEACRRAGERLQAIASYRVAANLLLELGCETRARGALKAALELDPNDPVLQEDVARLEPRAILDEQAFAEAAERSELPLLPPLDSGVEQVPPPPAAMRSMMAMHVGPSRQQALPPVQRALPAMPSVPPLVPPVLLPAPGMRSAPPGPRTLPPISRTRSTPAPAPAQATAPVVPPRLTPTGPQPQAPRPQLAPRSATGGFALPVLQPVGLPVAPSMTPPPQPMRSATPAAGLSPHGPVQTAGKVLVPPPPPAETQQKEERAVAPQPPAPMHMPQERPRLEVRRLSPNVLAFRDSPTDSWALIRSRTPLEMHLVENLDQLPPEQEDFALDILVEPESASSAMH
jgi:hypothetical protein